MLTLADLDAAAALLRPILAPTPQLRWPLLEEAVGTPVWVKHENHLPTGAFKVRGGLIYLDHLRRTAPSTRGIISATRGNHGQSLAFAAARLGLQAVIAVPLGNSREKNAAMRSYGAELVEVGHDFQAAREWAGQEAARRGLHLVPSWHPLLVQGVATGALEWLRAVPELEVVYVPIGMGSGICGMIAAREALGHRARVVGVVSERAPAYARSFEAGAVVPTETADTFADGIATRSPDATALAMIRRGAERIVRVSESALRDAMRLYFRAIHQVAEGAGAAALAGLLTDRERTAGQRAGVVLSGGNVDREVYAAVLAGEG